MRRVLIATCLLLGISIALSYAQILKVTGANVDATLPPPPPPCSTFNISGPLSSLDVGNSSNSVPVLSELTFNIVSSSGTFGFAFKQQDVVGGGRTLHIKVGTLSPLNLIVDQSVVSWPPTAQEDGGFGFGSSANGYVLNFRPDAFFQPLQRRTVLYSADNGSLLGTQNFTDSVDYAVGNSSSIGLSFDGGRFYSTSVGGSGIVAWNHGVSTLTSGLSFSPIIGFGYDGTSKIYTSAGTNSVMARFAKFNGTSTVLEATFDPGLWFSPDFTGGLVFGNGKLYISDFPSGALSIIVARLNGNPFSTEQSIFLNTGDSATYTGSRLVFDSTNNKLYLISNSNVGRRIFRLNPTNLSVEQAVTISGAGLAFFLSDESLHIRSNGRRMYTLEIDSNTQRYFLREYSLCS
jgi:hypothetical protein